LTCDPSKKSFLKVSIVKRRIGAAIGAAQNNQMWFIKNSGKYCRQKGAVGSKEGNISISRKRMAEQKEKLVEQRQQNT